MRGRTNCDASGERVGKGSEGEREVLQVCLLRGTRLGKEWEKKSLALLYLLNTSIPGEINKL